MPARSKTETLPPNIKAEITRLYTCGAKLTDIADAVNELLVAQGDAAILNKDNVHRMIKRRDAVISKIKQSREVAEMLVSKFGDDSNIERQTESIVVMGQSLIMDLMMNRTEEHGKNVELNIDRLASGLQSFVGALVKQQNFLEKTTKAAREKLANEITKKMEKSPGADRALIDSILQELGIKDAETV